MMPSDEELDCLFRAWTAPQSPDTLERRIRQAYRDRTGSSRVWSRWIPRFSPAAGLFAGIAAGAVVFLLVIAQAFPQSLSQSLAGLSGGTFPFTVDSEEIAYQADGSSVVVEYFTSAGGGLILSSEFPGDPLRTAQQRILDPLNLILFRIAAPVRERQVARRYAIPGFAKRVAELERTCTLGYPWTVAGNVTILNYPTTMTQKEWMEDGKPVRFTQWSAPDLRCATLKSTTEKTFEGKLRLAFEQRALKVTMNGRTQGYQR